MKALMNQMDGSTVDGSRGSWVSSCDQLTHDPLTDD